MSRIRSIHPGLWTDDAFMALSAHARLLVIGIWTEAFDDGVFEWKPLTLKARIFPVDTVDVGALLDELLAGAFVRKEEFDGRQIGLVRNFRDYQRPKKPNSSGMFKAEWRTYVGISDNGTEPVPNQSATNGEKSPQMEDGGGRVKEEDRTSPPVHGAEAQRGAGVSFEDLVEAYPRDPGDQERRARAAFEKIQQAERAAVIAAAERVARHHAQDCEARGRSLEEGARFVTTLPNWLDSGQWREASKLPVKAEAAAVVVPMTRLDRERDRDLWLACERIMGKPAPTSGMEWSFRTEIVDQAKAGVMH